MLDVPVNSSNINCVGYDAKNASMDIEFRDGGVYRYYDVPVAVYEQFLLSDSKGKFFHAQLKGVFTCQCLSRKGQA
jgi:hypothetical protein